MLFLPQPERTVKVQLGQASRRASGGLLTGNAIDTISTMKNRVHVLLFALCVSVVYSGLSARGLPVLWGDETWQLQIDPASGALVRLENRSDPHHMNWLREPGRWERSKWIADTSAEPITLDGQWGLVETSQTGLLHAGKVQQLSEKAWEAVYVTASLTVTVRRELDTSGELAESYTFKNTGALTLDLPMGSVAFRAPLFDQYPDAKRSLFARCHTHVWMGGSSAWINAMRMGGEAPHLGLVVTEGSLDAYSQRGGTLSDRGVFLLHPAAMKLDPGQSKTIAWRLFWHKGWDDFFAKLGTRNGFVHMSARQYTVTAGESLEITAESAGSLEGAKLLANGESVRVQARGGRLEATIPTTKPGELFIELINNGQKTWLRANVVPLSDELIAARVKFIIECQQRNAPGDPLDGAYLSFDNETGKQVHDAKVNDRNAGRERLAMGVLGALYLPLCQDEAFKAKLTGSLARYATFIARELEDDSGVVYNSIGRSGTGRLYNYPWVAHFHLAMYRATADASQLDRFVRVMRTYYARGGAKFYAIGIPATEGLKALDQAGRTEERAELIENLRMQADHFLKTGPNYPVSEVNYEQAIVGPAVQLLAEMYLITGEKSYLEGAKRQMPLLEAFCGKQPDHRLNEVAIRHWDDYWFGKLQLYGDTFPHYWSTINAMAYAYFGRATGEQSWLTRADIVLKANLSLFEPDGRATCAHLYPLTCNARPTAKNDPWANDQDWALINLLTIRGILKP
jgi:hypothetical protein